MEKHELKILLSLIFVWKNMFYTEILTWKVVDLHIHIYFSREKDRKSTFLAKFQYRKVIHIQQYTKYFLITQCFQIRKKVQFWESALSNYHKGYIEKWLICTYIQGVLELHGFELGTQFWVERIFGKVQRVLRNNVIFYYKVLKLHDFEIVQLEENCVAQNPYIMTWGTQVLSYTDFPPV